MFKRLFLQIYVAFIGIALLCAAVAGLAGRALREDSGAVPPVLAAGLALIVDEAPPEHLSAVLTRRAQRLGVDLSLWAPDGTELVRTGRPIDAPTATSDPESWVHTRGAYGVRVRLADGRWIAGTVRHDTVRFHRFLGMLGLMAGAVAIGCYPLTRRITGRLERLDQAVQRWGAGQLTSRAAVEGTDEVAALASSFNQAATRIEELMTAQQRILASASHELRAPLSRLRLTVELLDDDQPEKRAYIDGAIRDMEELDALVGDILLSAKLDARMAPPVREPVDVGGLAREEAAAVGATVSGDAMIMGDARLLRRMLRNLLENARRYGGGTPIDVELRPGQLMVSDRGPGVAPAEQERIFEPFYRPPGHRETQDGGVGLGLWLVRQIAEHHGAKVQYQARAGGGSSFVVVFVPTLASA